MKHLVIPLVAFVVLIGALSTPVAAQPADPVDECQDADRGPGGDGPPGFVASQLPDFLSDLFAALPVPNFVKALFGAPAC